MKPSRVAALLLLSLLIGVAHPAGDKGSEPPKGNRVDALGDPLPTGVLARMGTIRFRHGATIQYLQYARDGKVLASLGTDQTIRLWDTDSGKELQSFHVPESPNAPFAVSSDGKYLATTNFQRIRIWDTKTGKELHAIDDQNASVTALVFSPDGKTLAATSGPEEVSLIDVSTGKESRRMKGPQNQGNQGFYHQSLCFSADGKVLAMSGSNPNDGTQVVHFLPVTEDKDVRHVKLEQQVTAFQLIAPDHKTIAQWGNDQDIHIIGTDGKDEGKELHKINIPEGILSFAYSGDGKYLATAIPAPTGQGALTIWDVRTGNKVNQDESLKTPVNVMAFAPNGKSIAVGGGASSIIRIVDVKKGTDIHPVVGHVGTINELAISPDGKTVATIGEDHVVCFWTMANGKEIRRIDGPGMDQPGVPSGGTVAFSADGKQLAVSWTGQPIVLYDVATGKKGQTIGENAENPLGVSTIVFTPDGKSVAGVCNDGAVRFWDLRTGKEQRRFPEAAPTEPPPERKPDDIEVPVGGISLMALAPNGKLMITLGSDATDATGLYSYLRVWELATGKERQKIRFKQGGGGDGVIYKEFQARGGALLDDVYSPGVASGTGLTVSPNGRFVALTFGATVQLVDLTKGKAIRQFGAEGESLCTAMFSPDGKTLAAGASDGTIRFWDVATGTALGEFTGHRGSITALVYAPDGKALVTGGVDTTAMSWDVPYLRESLEEKPASLTRAQAQALVDDLADNAKVQAAMTRILRDPKEAIPLIRERLKPVDKVTDAKVADYIKDLASDDFDVRQKANAELEKLGDLARPALEKRLAEKPELDLQKRIEELLEKLDKPIDSPEIASSLRMIELLEYIGTPEARKILEDLSKGAEGAKITVDAKAALARLSLR
jgi:WD40 repeat protein